MTARSTAVHLSFEVSLTGRPIARLCRPIGVALVLAQILRGTCAAAPLPPDVRANHWAATAVTRTVKAGVLRVQSDGQFHGEARVSRSEAAIALATLGRGLLQGTWTSAGKSKAVPDSVAAVWQQTDWTSTPVRRYTFASVTARLADYIANALKQPASTARLGQSEVIPTVEAGKLPTGPSLEALKYLARNHMLRPDSPLLKPDSAPLTGGELSRALAELATGITDRMTDLGPPDEDSEPPKK